MKLELFQDGKLVVSIEPVGDVVSGDFTILPKSILTGGSLSSKTFEELFFKCIKETSTYIEAYEKAEGIHEQYFERRRYSCYESFSRAKKLK
jgi:hypothetical protein